MLPMCTMSYISLSEKIIETKGPRTVALCGREENWIVIETPPTYKGDQAFPSAPPTRNRMKAILQWNILYR